MTWGSAGSATVIEKRSSTAPQWQVISFTPDVGEPQGLTIDDLVAQFQAEGVDVAGARREMGGMLADAGEVSLRGLRLAAGLSQRELGERIGMSQPNVARLERHPGDVGLHTLRKLAEALGVDLNTLGKAIP